MTKQEIKEIIRDRDLALQGQVTPSRVVEVAFDAGTGKFTHTELDPAEWRREMATKHAARVAKARAQCERTR
jgi:hypothetical protein